MLLALFYTKTPNENTKVASGKVLYIQIPKRPLLCYSIQSEVDNTPARPNNTLAKSFINFCNAAATKRLGFGN